MEGNVIICVPVYKQNLNVHEKASLLQLYRILKNYEITLFTYKELELTEYFSISEANNFKVTFFDKAYFKNTTTYSRLLLSTKFYKEFKNYKFLLIYQLDAWVFKDELQHWCDKNYDYIGAPWFTNINETHKLDSFYGIGNGGFSLRKVSSHLKVLGKFYSLRTIKNLFFEFRNNRIGYSSIKNLFLNLTVRNISHSIFTRHQNLNEDVFWSLIAEKNFKWFKVPDMLEASKFSCEVNAELLFEVNNQELPFGCHAWEIYDKKFWRKHINISC